MPTPIPTPFDIIAPAPDPVVPSLTAWLLLTFVAALTYCLIKLLYRSSPQRSQKNVLLATINEIRASTSPERVARLARRVLSIYLKSDITTLSPSELTNLARQIIGSNNSNEINQSSSKLLELVSQLELISYAPIDSNGATSTERLEVMQKLITAIESHVRRFNPA